MFLITVITDDTLGDHRRSRGSGDRGGGVALRPWNYDVDPLFIPYGQPLVPLRG